MSKWEFVQLKEVLRHQKGSVRSLIIDDATEYKLCRVQVHRKGVVLRKKQFGHEIKTKKQQLCHTGDLIVAEMDAKFGGYGFIPPNLEDSVVSSHYYLYELDYSKITQEYLEVLINTDYIQNQIEAKGSTNYSSIRAWEFLEYTIPLPSLEEQKSISKRFRTFADFKNELSVELNKQEKYISQLKQAILQEAIAGQLTAEWRTENPMQKGNPDTDAAALLAKIKAEKQQLIADGKLKKEKPLAEIAIDEIPFSIPDSWIWCRLGEIIFDTEAGKSPKCLSDSVENQEWGVIKTTAIQELLFLENENKILPKDFVLNSIYTIYENDLLITRAGPINRVGVSCCVKNITKNLILSDKTIRIKYIDQFVNPDYLAISINSLEIKKLLKLKMTGMADSQVNITQDNIKATFIPLPPLAEQKAIVEKCDRLMNIIDQLEQQIKHRKQLAEDLMQTVLREAFEY